MKQRNPILGEIIGATNLRHPASSSSSSNNNKLPLHPFCIVSLSSSPSSSNNINNESINATTQQVRRTKRVRNTFNPIWCVQHDCFFLLPPIAKKDKEEEETEEEDSSSTSLPLWFLLIEIWHEELFNPIQNSQLVASVNIPLTTIWDNCNEERLEFPLVLPNEANEKRTSTSRTTTPATTTLRTPDAPLAKVALRFRIATANDLKFLKQMDATNQQQAPKHAMPSTQWWETIFSQKPTQQRKQQASNTIQEDEPEDQHEIYPGPSQDPLLTERAQSISIKNVQDIIHAVFSTQMGKDGIERIRVKPYPDPKDKEGTLFLSREEFKKQMVLPSTNWAHVGCGSKSMGGGNAIDGESGGGKTSSEVNTSSLGKVYVEILQCQDLPKMDLGEGNLTDPFVCIIFEDSIGTLI